MAIDLFNDFATDHALESEGAWVPYAGDVEFLIARAGNKDYHNLMQKRYRQNKRVVDADTDAARALSEKLTIEVMAKTILKGVKGDFTWKGKKVEFSEALAVEMLGLKDFRVWVATQADDINNFKTVQDAEDAKN